MVESPARGPKKEESNSEQSEGDGGSVSFNKKNLR